MFTASGTGFLVTSSSFAGSLPASEGRIQRTTDGGASWVTVWQEPGASLYWVGTVGSEVVASGVLTQPGNNDSSASSPLLLVSTDGGTSWVPITPSLPSLARGMTDGGAWPGFRLDFLTRSVGLAVPDSAEGQELLDAQLLRTTDAGRHWVVVELPGGTPNGGLAFVDPVDGFATGTTAGCQGQIWSTHDSGANWQPVPGTCEGYVLDALSFPDSQDGFAAGGNYYKFGLYPQLALLATTNGGRNWTTRYAQGGSPQGGGGGAGGPFANLRFVTPTVGYALSGGCVMGANGPCGGPLWSTTNAGHTWNQSSVSGLRLATNGADSLWLVDARAAGGGDVLWHSSNRAASWTPVADVANIAISNLAVSGDTLWIATDAGQFISTDKGRSWAALPAAAQQAEQHYGTVVAVGPSGLVVIGGENDQVWISHDGGISGRMDSVPVHYEVGTIAFANDRQALAVGLGLGCDNNTPVVTTTDGGSTWHQASTVTVGGLGRVSYGSSLAVLTGLIGTGCPNAVATSTDGGKNWTTWSFPPFLDCLSTSAAGDTAILFCADKTSPTAPVTILVTRSAGRDWYSYTLQTSTAPTSVVASSSGQLWAIGPPGLLWHSTDGGADWEVLTPTLPVAN